LEELNVRPRNIPIIRLVEMDGFQGAIGVACLDPLSPTTDSVFGVKVSIQHFTLEFFVKKCITLLKFGFLTFWQKNIGTKAARKMLIKFTKVH